MFGNDDIMAARRDGCLIIDIGTIDPKSSAQVYSEVKEHGLDDLETPLSGGELGGAGQTDAKRGNITFMAGGDKEALERARPVLDVLGRHAI